MAVHPFLLCSMWEDNKQVVVELTSTALQYFDVKVEEEEEKKMPLVARLQQILYCIFLKGTVQSLVLSRHL